MPLSSATKQTEDVLEEVLRIIAEAYPVLSETDRNKFVEKERSLSEQLKEMMESESNSWWGFLSRPSPRAAEGLKKAEELRQHVREDINAKLRTTGKNSPHRSPAFNLMGPRTPETDAPLAEGNPESANSIITSPLSTRCSPSEPGFSEMSINPAVQNDHDYTSDINEAINSPLETSSEPSDRSRDSSSRPHRRSSPPPPPLHLSPLHIRSFLSEPEVSVAETSSESSDSDGSRDSSSTRRRRLPPSPPPRRMAQSDNPRPLSETSSNSGIDTPRRSHSVRRPAPPPPQSPRQSRMPRSPISVSSPPLGLIPTSSDSGSDTPRLAHSARRPAPPPPQSPRQSRTPRSPPNVSSTSHGPLPLDPAGMARFAQGMKTFAASMTRDLSRQTRGARCSDSVIMSNCVGITNSNVDGMTVNNGGTNNSGAVIHKTVMPPPLLPRHVPHV